MKIKITYQNKSNSISCPTNTYFTGFILPKGIKMNYGLQYLFKDTLVKKEKITLPNGKKIKVIYYINKELCDVIYKYPSLSCMHFIWEEVEVDVYL